MAALSQLSRAALFQLRVAAFNASPGVKPVATDDGSSLGAVLQAGAVADPEIQRQVAYVASIARFYTIPPSVPDDPTSAPSEDAISFAAPFGIAPLGESASSGGVQFTAPSPLSAQLVIPVGGIVGTSSGVQFEIIADPTNSAYSAALNGYPVAASAQSVIVTVQSLILGTVTNIQAGTITQIYGGPGAVTIPGTWSATNPQAFANAQNFETDAQFKNRFTKTVSGQRAGTQNAIVGAILAVQSGLVVSYGDMLNASGGAAPGYVSIYVNVAKTGAAAPSSLVAAAQTAALTVKPGGITVTVYGPTIAPVAFAGTVHVLPGYSVSTVVAACVAALTTWANAVGMDPNGGSSRLALGTAYAQLSPATIPGLAYVDGLTLNGTAADAIATFGNQLVAGSFTGLTGVSP